MPSIGHLATEGSPDRLTPRQMEVPLAAPDELSTTLGVLLAISFWEVFYIPTRTENTLPSPPRSTTGTMNNQSRKQTCPHGPVTTSPTERQPSSPSAPAGTSGSHISILKIKLPSEPQSTKLRQDRHAKQ